MRRSRERDFKQAFNARILPKFGSVELTEITTGSLRAWQAELLKSGLKVKSARNIIDSSFRSMFRDARGEIEALSGKDPFIDVKWPKIKREPPDPLTREEKQRILEPVS